MTSTQPLALVNARLVDPESGYDGPGGVIVSEGVIADVAKGREFGKLSKAVRVVDCGGALLAPEDVMAVLREYQTVCAGVIGAFVSIPA